MKIQTLTTLCLLLLLSAGMPGCDREDLSGGEDLSGAPVAINLHLPATLADGNNAPVSDETVSRVRILAFQQGGGPCKMNTCVDFQINPLKFPLITGKYDFYFLINEPESLTADLDALNSVAQLNDYQIGRQELVSAEGLYVMSAVQKNVYVTADFNAPEDADKRLPALVSYTDDAGAMHSNSPTFEVRVRRLAAKMNLNMVRKNDPTAPVPDNQVELVKITGLPAAVHVVDGINSVRGEEEVTLVRQPVTLADTPPADAADYVYEAIIPSYLFDPCGDKTQASLLSVKLAGENTPRTLAIGTELANTNPDYTLHRNVAYYLKLTVSDKLDLNVSVLDWDERLVSPPPLGAWKWNAGNDPVYLPSRSPIGLRRSGILSADDNSLKYTQVEIIDEASPAAPRVTCEYVADYAPMHDRDNAAHAGYVDHLKNCNNSDIVLTQTGGAIGEVAASVGDDMKVTLRIYHPTLPGGKKDVTVYLKRPSEGRNLYRPLPGGDGDLRLRSQQRVHAQYCK